MMTTQVFLTFPTKSYDAPSRLSQGVVSLAGVGLMFQDSALRVSGLATPPRLPIERK